MFFLHSGNTRNRIFIICRIIVRSHPVMSASQITAFGEVEVYL